MPRLCRRIRNIGRRTRQAQLVHNHGRQLNRKKAKEKFKSDANKRYSI